MTTDRPPIKNSSVVFTSIPMIPARMTPAKTSFDKSRK